MNTENHDTFFARLHPFFAPSVVTKIEGAYMMAKEGHRHQQRKEVDVHGDPVRYFEHVRRATLIGLDLAKIVRFDTTVALVFHDSFEDSKRLTPDIVEAFFGSDICGIVKVLSKTPKDGYLDRFYVSTDWRPYFCKACDRLDNLKSLEQATPEFRAKQVAETKDRYFRLFDRMVTLTPEEYRDGVRRLRDEIHEVAGSLTV